MSRLTPAAPPPPPAAPSTRLIPSAPPPPAGAPAPAPAPSIPPIPEVVKPRLEMGRPQTLPEAIGTAVPRGAVETTGTAIEGLGAATDPARRRVELQTLEGLLREGKTQEAHKRFQIGDLKGLQPHMVATDFLYPETRDATISRVRSEIEGRVEAARGGADKPLSENTLIQAGQDVKQFGAGAFPVEPQHEQNLAVQVARGAGSTVPFVATHLVPVAGPALTATFALSAGAGEAYENAAKAGASDEDQARAAVYGILPGGTDIAPIENLFRAVPFAPGFKGAVYGILRKAIEQGLIEGGQEMAQQAIQNIISKIVHTPKQEIDQGVAENGAVGFLVGMLFGGGAGSVQALPSGEAPPPPPQTTPQPETPTQQAPVEPEAAPQPDATAEPIAQPTKLVPAQPPPPQAEPEQAQPQRPSTEDLRDMMADERSAEDIREADQAFSTFKDTAVPVGRTVQVKLSDDEGPTVGVITGHTDIGGDHFYEVDISANQEGADVELVSPEDVSEMQVEEAPQAVAPPSPEQPLVQAAPPQEPSPVRPSQAVAPPPGTAVRVIAQDGTVYGEGSVKGYADDRVEFNEPVGGLRRPLMSMVTLEPIDGSAQPPAAPEAAPAPEPEPAPVDTEEGWEAGYPAAAKWVQSIQQDQGANRATQITGRRLVNAVPGLTPKQAKRIIQQMKSRGTLTRSGKTKQLTKPRNVTQIIKDFGGIVPSAETRQADMQKAAPGLIRRKGKSLHDARIHLEELGIIQPDARDEDVLELVSNDLRGNPAGIYHPDDEDILQQVMAEEAQSQEQEARENVDAELSDFVKRMGGSVATDEREEIVRRVTEGEKFHDVVEEVFTRSMVTIAEDHLASDQQIEDIPFDEIATEAAQVQPADERDGGMVPPADAARPGPEAEARLGESGNDGRVSAQEEPEQKRLTKAQRRRTGGPIPLSEIHMQPETVTLDDGSQVTIELTAQQAMDRADARISALEALRNCLNG